MQYLQLLYVALIGEETSDSTIQFMRTARLALLPDKIVATTQCAMARTSDDDIFLQTISHSTIHIPIAVTL